MESGLIAAAAAAERCVQFSRILLGSAELRVNETVLIPEGTLVDAAPANAAVINRLQSVKGNISTSSATTCLHTEE